MRMSRFFCIAAIAICSQVVVLPALAQRAANVRGAGGVGCGEFLEDRQADRFKQFYIQWFWGYLSAYGIYSRHPQLRTIPDDATIDAYLQKHCRDNPLDSLLKAAGMLVRDLGGYDPVVIKK